MKFENKQERIEDSLIFILKSNENHNPVANIRNIKSFSDYSSKS